MFRVSQKQKFSNLKNDPISTDFTNKKQFH